MRLGKVLTYSLILTCMGLICCSCNSSKSLSNYLAPITQNKPVSASATVANVVSEPSKSSQSAHNKSAARLDGAVEIASAGLKTNPNAPSMVGSKLLVRTTAYCHKEKDSLQYGLKNAAGGTLKYTSTIRSAAADWSRFPMGTRFKIHGEPQEYVIDDYGSALVGSNTIDIYKPTFTKMNEWGVRHIPIEIIEWGCFEESREILDGRKHVKHADHVREMLNEINGRYAIEQPAASDSQPRA